METKFRKTKIAASISMIVGSSLLLPTGGLANGCSEFAANGTCGLKESQMTSPLDPKPTAWYFTSPTQDAAINSSAKAQNIYFASGTSSRATGDVQNLLVHGANLSGYYINASTKGTANITLANNASVDWLEAGGASTDKTNVNIVVDHSKLNGVSADNNYDYDRNNVAPKSTKSYAKGSAIYLTYIDSGNETIDIRNGSSVNGRIVTGGAGTKDIKLTDSEITAGGIVLLSAGNTAAVTVKNSKISNTGAAVTTNNALEISNTALNTVTLDNSQLTGALSLSSTGNNNDVSLTSSSVMSTDKTGNAVHIANGKTTDFTAENSDINGHMLLFSTDNINATLIDSDIAGNITLNKAAQMALNVTRSTVDGSITATIVSTNTTNINKVDIQLLDSSVTGDIDLNNTKVLSSSVRLDNSTVGGKLYGSANSTLTLANQKNNFDVTKFSNFSNLTLEGATTTVAGDFTNSNVGSELTVSGGIARSNIQLSAGKLAFDGSKLYADTLALSDSASLALSNHSLLETSINQLFDTTRQFNDTAAHISLLNSTLALTDDYTLDDVKTFNSRLGEQFGTDNTLLMMGDLQDTTTNKVSVVDAASTQAVLAQVQVASDNNNLVIGGESAGDDATAVANGFGAAQLLLEGTGNPAVTIAGGQSLTLTGAQGGSLIEVANQPDAVVNLSVNDGGKLNLGSQAVSGASNSLRGVVNVGNEGTMNIVAGNHTILTDGTTAGVISSGLVNIANNATLRADVALQDSGSLAVNGVLQAGKLIASEGTRITVGNADSAGALIVASADLNGAEMFIDPIWGSDPTLNGASQVAIGGSEVNGLLTAGQNSLLVLGDTSAASAISNFTASGLKWGSDGITSALAINTPQTLNANSGGLRIDGSLTQDSRDTAATLNQATFADHSLLMVDSAAASGNNAALSATDGTLNVAGSAALYVANAKANQTYTITKGFSNVQIAGSGWQNGNLMLNKLLNATASESADGTFTVTTSARASQEILPGVVTAKALNAMIHAGSNSTTSPHAGTRFLSLAVDSPTASVRQVVDTINSAAQIAVAGGVQSSTYAVGMAAVDAIHDRTSIANHALQARDLDSSVWVHALYGNQHGRDYAAGSMNYGYNSNFYGLMLGGDVRYDSTIGKLLSGAAFHAGNGSTHSSGDFNATHNDFNFWGVSLYQNWNRGGFNVTGDIGYSAANNDLNQNLPGWMNFGNKLKGSVDSQLLTVGVDGEYLIATPVVDVIPHVGARYNQLVSKTFDTKNSRNESVFRTEKETQNIWQFPVGVKLDKTFALDSGWALSAQADIAVISVAGDTRADSKIRTIGINAVDNASADIIDDTSFNGQLGVKLRKGNMTWGVGYNLNSSSHDTAQTVIATYKLTF